MPKLFRIKVSFRNYAWEILFETYLLRIFRFRRMTYYTENTEIE